MEFRTASEAETEECARTFAAELRAGDVVCLQGNLGMGKSTFARALIRTACNDPHMEVPSPTFTLVQIYEGQSCPIWHFDLYRIKSPEEIWELGWDDALAEGIVLVEWPERLGNLLPTGAKMLHFTATGPTSRLIRLTAAAP